jgi:hypothetical protein
LFCMSEQEKPLEKRVPHRWGPGQSGNPRGRPRRPEEQRLAPLLREKIPIERMVAKAEALVDSANESLSLQALQFVAQYAGHKPADKHEIGPPAPPDEDTSVCTDEELLRLDELETERAAILERARIRALPSGT